MSLLSQTLFWTYKVKSTRTSKNLAKSLVILEAEQEEQEEKEEEEVVEPYFNISVPPPALRSFTKFCAFSIFAELTGWQEIYKITVET